ADATPTDSGTLAWSLIVLADLAESEGAIAVAREALEQALELVPEDIRPRIAYADFLLRQDDPEGVLEIISSDTASSTLLLRRALAAKALALAELDGIRARLHADFATAALRGDSLHEREESLANLALFDRPDVALKLATRNWERQREFMDTYLVLAAAQANGQPHAARQTLAWLRAQGTVDQRLIALTTGLGDGGGDHEF
ncbi:MAG: hypothetical protein WBM65_07680, partial [Sedimenticolaceae bacterium]